MTKDEFEKSYAERSGLTVEALHKLGLKAHPCECGAYNCPGWQMVSERQLRMMAEVGLVPGDSENG